jgi:pimeloyl-ACP methyl ester carboxylesterase
VLGIPDLSVQDADLDAVVRDGGGAGDSKRGSPSSWRRTLRGTRRLRAANRALSPAAKAVGRLFRTLGLGRIPPEALARIVVPTTLIWGRHDRANRLRIAEAASARYGWPLHVIEGCADDPPRDQPAAFLAALRSVFDGA